MLSGEASRRTLEIAIVGSGPSGFYAAEALLQSGLDVRITMIERLPTPYGLVRSGVAPDHQKLKQPILAYDEIARNAEFVLLGNVAVGRDISVAELQASHHAVILACGAHKDKPLGVPGEDLTGSHAATEFVGWYNGHPDFRDLSFDLGHDVAVVVGHGNVAADVCRILSKPVDELRHSDIADHALEVLAESKIKEIHVVGRRGPAHAKFTAKELRELGTLTNVTARVKPEEFVLNETSRRELEDRSSFNAAKNVELFRKFAECTESGGQRKIWFRFCVSPVALKGQTSVETVVLARNRLKGPAFAQEALATDQTESVPCGLVLRSVGYQGVPLPGVPFDAKRGVVPNLAGCVVDGDCRWPGLYVTGWLKRGANGIIGTNRADSNETVASLLADMPDLAEVSKPGAPALRSLLQDRGVTASTFSDWLKIDSAETERGSMKGKPREKFTRIGEMLDVAGKSSPTGR